MIAAAAPAAARWSARGASARTARPAHRPARDACAKPARRRRHHPAGARRAARAASAAGGAVRHLGLDEPVRAHVPALPARDHQRPRPRHVFVFGTRLTNITRQLRHRDVDVAMARVADGDQGLVGRHAHRRQPARVQLAVGAARARAERRACCSSPTASTARPARASARRWSGSPSPAATSSGSTRCCATRSSRRARPACARCCRTWISSCRCIISRAWSTSRETLSEADRRDRQETRAWK